MTVATVPFLEVVKDASAGNIKIPQSEFLLAGSLAVVDQGQGLIAGYTENREAAVRAAGPVIVFGDHTRVLKFVDFPFAMGADGVKVLRVDDDFDPKFVYRYLQSRPIASAGYSRHFKFLKEIRIPKPQLVEQRRIATILDHADALRAKRRQVLAHLDTLTQSIFHDMFGDGSALPQRRFRDVVARLEGGRSIVADDVDAVSRYRVLKISAVTTNHFQSGESKPLPAGYEPPADHFVHKGDLLFSRANTTELVGAVALVEDLIESLVLPDKLWRFVWREPDVTDAVYVWKLLQTRPMRRAISSRSSGTGGSMKNISKAKLQDMLVPWPSVHLQRQFAARVEEIGSQRVTMQRALAADNELFASVQSRAFRGEL